MTVVSRPVMAGVECVAPSATLSAAVSGGAAMQICSGLSPDQWSAIATQWPGPYCGAVDTSLLNASSYEEPTLFHCPTTGFGGRVYGSWTLLQVIDFTNDGRSTDSLGRYIVAALLNARSGRTPVVSQDDVRNMWNDLVNRGYYEAAPGVRWEAAEIVDYIKTTIG